jgi:hypothetical protein
MISASDAKLWCISLASIFFFLNKCRSTIDGSTLFMILSCDAWEKEDIICCLHLIPVIRPFFFLVENPASHDFLFQIPEEKNKLWHVD